MNEQLGIIKNPKFGVRDINQANLSFTVETIDGSALQVLLANEAIELIEKHHITDISNLEGKPCIAKVRPERNEIIFIDLKK